jgi:hypothetical protein
MLQLYSRECRAGKFLVPPRINKDRGGQSRRRVDERSVPAMAMVKQTFRMVQARCRFLEEAEERDGILSRVPPAVRKFAPDERYLNALLELYARCTMEYAGPTKSNRSYRRWSEKSTSKRFARREITVYGPVLMGIITEMHRHGYEVPPGLRFLLIGHTSDVDIEDSEPLWPLPPGPPPKQNPQRIPVLRTRGLVVRRRRHRRRVRHGV